MFLKENEDLLKNNVLFCDGYERDFYQRLGNTIVKFFPEHTEQVDSLKNIKIHCNRWNDDLDNSFIDHNIHCTESGIQLPETVDQLYDVRGSQGESLIHLAVQKNDTDLLIRLLEAGCDFDALDNEGNHVIHYVRNVEMLEFLLEIHPSGNALLNVINVAEGYSVLHKICTQYMDQNSHCELLQKALDYGANVHQLTKTGESVIFLISSCSLLDILLKHGASLDTVNENEETALERHLKNRNEGIVNVLYHLVHGTSTFKEHAHKFLALMVEKSHSRDIFSGGYQILLEKFPKTTKLLFDSLFQHSPEEASRVFSLACNKAMNFVLRKFLEFDYNLNYNLLSDYGYPPILALFSYIEEPNLDIVRKLLKKGVDLNVTTYLGANTLISFVNGFSTANWFGYTTDTVQLLVDHGVEINAMDNEGNTALHIAVATGKWELVEALLRNGADASLKNHAGLTPMETARRMDRELYFFIE
ncbi:putative ankyrin repeat protein RF_0381 isoform X2 [Uranotaenia lowii]|nr:putative ankyrin repeat protein RF_0381 isoform X2 [Uranotaenia lowii]